MKRQGSDQQPVLDVLRQLPRGTRIALGVLAVTILIAVGALPFAFAAVEEADAEFRRLRAATNQTRGEAQQAVMDYDYVVANADRYKNALGRGVLDPQDRLDARQRLDTLMSEAYLVRMGFEMAAAVTQQGPGGFDLITTPIKMEVSAMLDRDIFVLLRDLEDAFPGYGVLRGFRLTRGDAVTDEALRRVTAGEPLPFVTGSVTLEWRSATAPGGQGAGGQGAGAGQ